MEAKHTNITTTKPIVQRCFTPAKILHNSQEVTLPSGFCKYLVEITNTRLFAVGDTEGNVTFWDSDTLKHIYTLTLHKGWINHMLYLKENRLLITTSTDQAICVYNLPQDLSQSTKKGEMESNWILHLLDLEEEGLFGSCSECCVKLWDIETLKLVEEIRSYACHYWQYVKKMKCIFFAHDDGTIALYDMRKKKWQRSVPLFNQNMSCSTFSLVEYVEKINMLITIVQGERIIIWKLCQQRIHYIKKIPIMDLSNSVPCLAAGKYLLGSDGEGKIYAYNALSGKVLREIDLGIEPLMWLFLKNECKIIVPDIISNKIYVLKYGCV